MLYNKRPWLIKPPPGTPLVSGSLAPDILAYPFNEGAGAFCRNYALAQEVVSPPAGSFQPTGLGNPPSWVQGPNGPALRASGTSASVAINLGSTASMNLASGFGVTILLGRRRVAGASGGPAFGIGTNAAYLGAYLPYTDGTCYWDFNDQTPGSGRISIASLSFGNDVFGLTVGPRGQEIWFNGKLVQSQGTSQAWTGTDIQLYLGGYPKIGITPDAADYDFFYLWSRQLTPHEIQALSIRPFSVFQSNRIETFFSFQVSTLAIVATSIPSSEAWGTPAVVAGPFIAASAIPSSEAWGSPAIAGPIVAAAIPSSEAWGTPHVAGGAQPVVATGIPSSEAWGLPAIAGPVAVLGIPSVAAWGTPAIAGPVAAASIPSSEAWGLPTLNVHQSVAATAIPPSEAWGTPRVQLVQSIVASGIPSSEAWGLPKITGGPQRVFMQGIPSSEAWGYPEVVGGSAIPIQIFIAGIERTAFLKVLTANPQSTTLGRSTLQFDLVDETGEYTPELAQTVVLLDFGVRRFGGCMNDIIVDRQLSTDAIFYHCTAIDKGGICDHRVVFKTYTSGSNWADVVRDIVATFLNGEGFTTLNVPVTSGTLSSAMPFYGCTVRQAFDQIAADVGTVWWVDENSDLHFPENLVLQPCPFSLSETSKNWRKLTVETTLVAYRNKQWAVSNQNTVPDPADSGGLTDITVTETYVLPQGAAQAAGFVLGTLVLNMAWQKVVSLKVNGVAQPFITGPETYLCNIRHSWWGFAGSPYIYCPNVLNDIPSLPTPPEGTSPDPITGDVVEVKYISQVRSAQVAQEAALAPLDPGLGSGTGTCGSGVYEAVEQVKNITSIEDLNAIAVAVLERDGGVPTILQFETDVPGAAVGMYIPVNLPKNKLVAPTGLIITSVNGQSLAVDLGWGSTFRWTIQATAPTDIGNWVKWFERLIERTDNAIPTNRYEEGQFILAPGTSLSAGAVATNPVIVSNTGRLFEVLIAANEPPVGQDLVVDVLARSPGQLPAAATSIFLPGQQPVLQANELDVQLTGAAAFGESYIFRNQILTPVASYRVRSTGTLTAASGVTMKIRWAY